jgi:1,4-alpha-glucan branching enzyme
MGTKYFSLVLHSHIPYVVAHGTWPHGMDWLYEAAAETYLPLFRTFRNMAEDGIPPQVTIGFTPVLMAQLKHPHFIRGFERYLRMKVEACRSDRRWFDHAGESALSELTRYWEDFYVLIERLFEDDLEGDILAGYRRLQDDGHLEILTSAATHGYFALLSRDESIRSQVRQGRVVYEKYFGRPARGFWIPECSFRPRGLWKNPFGDGPAKPRAGVDEILKSEGLDFFFVDSHLLLGGNLQGMYEDRFPALREFRDPADDARRTTPNPERTLSRSYLSDPSLAAFFARDQKSGAQVWSRTIGYPGDGAYLEFHKKHFPGGGRYWRITSPGADLADKALYIPTDAASRSAAHAGHFVRLLEEILADRDEGTICSMYDAELFGHWWFEGPEWMSQVLRQAAGGAVRPRTVGGSLLDLPPREIVSLPEGSWGEGGGHHIWFNPDTADVWRKIYRIEEEAAGFDLAALRTEDRSRDLLRQFFREKFLLESSDWPFLISTGSARDYAEQRMTEHFDRATALAGWLKRGTPLSSAEERRFARWVKDDGLFEDVVLPDGSII